MITLESLAGKPCTLKVPGWADAVQVSKGRKIRITKISDGEFAIDPKKGETILLSSKSKKVKALVKPVNHVQNEANYFGIQEGDERKPLLEHEMLEYKKTNK